MTTSGTTTFTATRDQIIDDALANIGVIAAGETPSAGDYTACAFKLNMILKTLNIEGYLLWCYLNVTIPLVSGAGSYTVGPTGGVTTGGRPLRIAQAWNYNSTTNAKIQMIQLSRNDFNVLTPANSPGIPTNFYYDPQLNNGIINIWPVINQTGYSIIISEERPIEDITASGQNFDLPVEWLLPLSWILTDEICHRYTVNLQKTQMIQQRAEMWREKISNWGTQEPPSIYFTVDPQMTYRG